MNLRGLVLVASFWPNLAAAAGPPTAADRACLRLVEAAQARQQAGAGKNAGRSAGKSGQYVCERQPQASARFVFALRWRSNGLPAAGSNLVGYYLVDTASGRIHAWNLGEDQPGEALAAVPVANPPRGPSSDCPGPCAIQGLPPAPARTGRTP